MCSIPFRSNPTPQFLRSPAHSAPLGWEGDSGRRKYIPLGVWVNK